MRSSPSSLARFAILTGVLSCAATYVQARVNWSVDLNLGFPIGGYYNGPIYAGPGYGTVYGALPSGAVSLQIGGGRYWRQGGVYYRPWGPRWVVVAPPVFIPISQSRTVGEAAPASLEYVPSRPDPVIYPLNGQSAEQLESDRQDCNRWATTQPAALADAAVFHRAVQACMDGRGYTMN